MKAHAKTLLFYLPGMALLAIVGWTIFGALPGMAITGDVLSWLLELPVVTCYAMAAGAAALLLMHITGMNIDNSTRAALMQQAQAGDLHAVRALRDETIAWIVTLVLAGIFFWPHY